MKKYRLHVYDMYIYIYYTMVYDTFTIILTSFQYFMNRLSEGLVKYRNIRAYTVLINMDHSIGQDMGCPQ